MQLRFRSGFALALVLWAEGCTVGPNYKRPNVPVPGQFKETGPSAAAAQKPAIGYPDWWHVFQNSALDQLEAQSYFGTRLIRADLQKVNAGHLKRNAYLYTRQSTPRQVLENVESCL